MRSRNLTLLFLGMMVAAGTLSPVALADNNWPTWRGPDGDAVIDDADPPVEFGETKNLKWKVEIPGAGDGTPIVWDNKIIVQTAVPTTEDSGSEDAEDSGRRRGPPRGPTPTVPWSFKLLCLDRTTGETIWERTAVETVPHEGHHPSASHASYSPVTDGEKIWASFGSRGLYCYDLDGNQLWKNELFKLQTRNRFGEGSSPALAGNAVVVIMDHEGESKILAFNKDTGEKLWEQTRDEQTSWTTPVPVRVGDSLQVITSATNKIRSYDAQTGELIWECDGVTLNAIPTPVVAFGNVYCTSGFRGYNLKAIKLGAEGDLSGSDAIVWEVDKGTPYVASPLIYGENIYVTSSLRNIISAYKAKTGEPVYVDVDLEGMKTIYSSPVGAGGRIYLADREGTVIVLAHGDEFKVLATNKLDGVVDASPVVIGDTLYIRSETHLYCFEE